jgi:hypothetical protein
MATDKADMNNIYEEALSNLKNRKPAFSPNTAMSNTEKDQAAKDYYANVRTNVSSHNMRIFTPFKRLEGTTGLGFIECKAKKKLYRMFVVNVVFREFFWLEFSEAGLNNLARLTLTAKSATRRLTLSLSCFLQLCKT